MSEWKPIATYNQEIGSVIVATSTGHVGEATCEGDPYGSWWWANSYGEYWAEPIHVRQGQVTYWQPLPEPPSQPLHTES